MLYAFGPGGPVFAPISTPQRGFGEPLILVALAGGIVVLALFLRWENSIAAPMPPLRLFRRRAFSFANLETLAVCAGSSCSKLSPQGQRHSAWCARHTASGLIDAGARVAVAGPHTRLDVAGYRTAMGITAALVLAGGAVGIAGTRSPST